MRRNMVEHYEIAIYGTLVAWARQLGYETAATQLEQTLNEEKAADAKLTTLANSANPARGALAHRGLVRGFLAPESGRKRIVVRKYRGGPPSGKKFVRRFAAHGHLLRRFDDRLDFL
jgi:hypothetical protein